MSVNYIGILFEFVHKENKSHRSKSSSSWGLWGFFVYENRENRLILWGNLRGAIRLSGKFKIALFFQSFLTRKTRKLWNNFAMKIN